MFRIVCTRDIGDWAWDDTVDSFREDQWIAADAKLTALRRKFGPHFRLIWN